MQRLRPSFRGGRHRHTTNVIHKVVSGNGQSIGGQTLTWQKDGILGVPTWVTHQTTNLSGDEAAVLFSYSEDPFVAGLGLLRDGSAGAADR